MSGTGARHRAAEFLGLGKESSTGRRTSLFPWWVLALVALLLVWGAYLAATRTEWGWVAVDAFGAVVIGWSAVLDFRQRRA
jgi:hypothetical protein